MPRASTPCSWQQLPMAQRISAGFDLMHRLGKDYEKPEFGLRTVEATSFVHPRWVPQLAGDVLASGRSVGEKIGSGRARVIRSAADLEQLRKMLLAMAEDVRVVLIKLAEREGLRYRFEKTSLGDEAHPNSVRIALSSGERRAPSHLGECPYAQRP